MQYNVIENCFLEDMSQFEIPSFEEGSVVELTEEQALELEGKVELIQDTPPAQEGGEDGEVPPTPTVAEGEEPTDETEKLAATPTEPIAETPAVEESTPAVPSEEAVATPPEATTPAEETPAVAEEPKKEWAGGHTV